MVRGLTFPTFSGITPETSHGFAIYRPRTLYPTSHWKQIFDARCSLFAGQSIPVASSSGTVQGTNLVLHSFNPVFKAYRAFRFCETVLADISVAAKS
jgi:hypothetical protein